MKIRFVFAAIVGLLLACPGHAQEESTNNLVGVGISVTVVPSDHLLTIMDVIPNSPASVAGLKRGLVIEKIDGTPTDGMKLRQSVDMIRGAEGTKVTLVLVDTEQNTTNTVDLVREKIKLPPMDKYIP